MVKWGFTTFLYVVFYNQTSDLFSIRDLLLSLDRCGPVVKGYLDEYMW